MHEYLYVNVWRKDALVEEKEFILSDMKYSNGRMFINGKDYAIKIMGDDENKVTGFIQDAGDGCPRILANYRGMENQWQLDDVMLVE